MKEELLFLEALLDEIRMECGSIDRKYDEKARLAYNEAVKRFELVKNIIDFIIQHDEE